MSWSSLQQFYRPLAQGIQRIDFLSGWQFYGNKPLVWLAFVLISALIFVTLRCLQRVISRRLGRLAGLTATGLDDLIVKLIDHTNALFLLLISACAALPVLRLGKETGALASSAIAVALVVQAGLWGQQIIDHVLAFLARRRAEQDSGMAAALAAMGFISRLLLWSLAVLLALSNLGLNITTLLAGLGVGGVAVALAVQNVLGDLFASLSIVFDRPFVVGDFIIVDDCLGTVEHIGLKTTRLRSLSGEELIFANSDLLKSRVRNFKRLYERRVVFGFGVPYETAYEKLAAIPAMVREIITPIPKTRFDRAHFKEYGALALNFEVVYFVLDPDYNLYMDIQQAINLALFRRFQQEGISFAYPTSTIHVQGGNLAAAAEPSGVERPPVAAGRGR